MIVDVNGDRVDLFYTLLLCSGKYDFLPNVYEVIGKEKTIELISLFAGTTIRFPSEKDLLRTSKELEIFLRVERSKNQKHRSEIIRSLSGTYEIHEDTVESVHSRVKQILAQLGLENVVHNKR